MKTGLKYLALPIICMTILFVIMQNKVNELKTALDVSNTQKKELAYGNHALQTTFSMKYAEFAERNKKADNIIDSLKKKKKNISSVAIISVTDTFRTVDTFYLEGSSVAAIDDEQKGITIYGEFGFSIGDECLSANISTNPDIFPAFVGEIVNNQSIYVIAERVRPYNWFWRGQWKKSKWPVITDTHSNCGEVTGNIKVEIK